MAIDRWWAGWRSAYIAEVSDAEARERRGSPFAAMLAEAASDREAYILARRPEVFAVLNAYPYSTGHLLILPNREVGRLDELTPSEFSALWELVRDAVTAIETVYDPEGVNVGMNLGEAAGAGIPSHLHVHCLPRWAGDTNFMTSVAETRVLPEPLDVTWERLREAWPGD